MFWRKKRPATHFHGYFKIGRTKQYMNFSLVDNQNGTFLLQAVDSIGAPAVLPTDTNLTSSDPTIATATFKTGNAAGTYVVKAVKAGTVNMVATGTNSAGQPASTTFIFTITGGPAVGFTATLTDIQNN
jgi:hypothetical protein